MATRTGTASQVDASAGSGSTSVTVPADATAAIAFWTDYNALGISTLSTLTLGGNSFTTAAENATKDPNSDTNGVGVASLETLPGSGSQTLAWAWSDTDARDEGGGIIVVWVKDVDTGDLVRDADVDFAGIGGAGTRSVTITTNSTDLVLAVGQRYNADVAIDAATTFVDNFVNNIEHYDAGEYTAGASTTTCQTTGTANYDTIAAISLKHGSAPAGSRIAGPELLSNSATTIFTASTGGALVEMIQIANESGSAVDLTLSIGTDAAGTRLFDGLSIGANEDKSFRVYIPMVNTEVIQAYASTASVMTITIEGLKG